MSDDSKREDHRRLVDMIADAMTHAIKSGREAFAELLEPVERQYMGVNVDYGHRLNPLHLASVSQSFARRRDGCLDSFVIAELVGKQEDEPGAEQVRVFGAQIGLGLDQGFEDIIGAGQAGRGVEGHGWRLPRARFMAASIGGRSGERQRAATCWSGRSR